MSRRKKWKEAHASIKLPTVQSPTPESALIESLVPSVERASTEAHSLQARFSADPDKFFRSTVRWVVEASLQAPVYTPNSRMRDAWLTQFIMLEPHLAGIVASIASIDSNRGWTLTGGRNQVRRFTKSLHNFRVAPDLTGWRPGIRSMSYGFHGTDLGGVAEIARDGEGGPLAGFFGMDPTVCTLTGNSETPLQYKPGTTAREQLWTPADYLRVTDLAFGQESYNGLGWCGVSRALELAKVMVAVLMHDQESLGARMPKGLLLLKGISQKQWDTAMESRADRMSQKERNFYGGVEVIASGMEDISATLTALSSLPAGFNLETFTSLTLYGYALCFGYDAREFWPVSGGALGTATETEVQHRKATQKGAGDFSLAHQEQLQREDVLPETLQFEYEERDVQGAMAEVQLNLLHSQLATTLYESGLTQGKPLISQVQALQLLAEANVIPQEWTQFEEEVTATDDEAVDAQSEADLQPVPDTTGSSDTVPPTPPPPATTGSRARARAQRLRRDALLANDAIYRAAEVFPSDPIVRYRWPSGVVTTLVVSGADLLARHAFSVIKVERDSIPSDLAAYATIRAKFSRDIEGAMAAYLDDAGSRVTFYRNLMRASVDEAMPQGFQRGYLDAGGQETDPEDDAYLAAAVATQFAFVTDTFESLKAVRGTEGFDASGEAAIRAAAWSVTLDGLYSEGKLRGDKNKMLTFDGPDGEESCSECQSYKGKRHSAKWWITRDLVRRSGNDNFTCGRWAPCQHNLFTDSGEQWTE